MLKNLYFPTRASINSVASIIWPHAFYGKLFTIYFPPLALVNLIFGQWVSCINPFFYPLAYVYSFVILIFFSFLSKSYKDLRSSATSNSFICWSNIYYYYIIEIQWWEEIRKDPCFHGEYNLTNKHEKFSCYVNQEEEKEKRWIPKRHLWEKINRIWWQRGFEGHIKNGSLVLLFGAGTMMPSGEKWIEMVLPL